MSNEIILLWSLTPSAYVCIYGAAVMREINILSAECLREIYSVGDNWGITDKIPQLKESLQHAYIVNNQFWTIYTIVLIQQHYLYYLLQKGNLKVLFSKISPLYQNLHN